MIGLPQLLGHRGTRVSRTVPENTFAAFDLALARGCDGFEFDVRRTADGEAVVVHDPKHRGVVVAKAKGGQLKSLPRLQEVLKKYGSRGFLDIELKVGGLEPALLTALRNFPPARDYVVSSFLPAVILELRTRRSGIPLGIICETARQLERGRSLPVEFLILKETLVREELVREAHNAGRKVVVWTVNRPASMLRLARWEVDGLVSDDPALLVKTLRGDSVDAPTKRARSASLTKRGKASSRGAD